MKVEDMKGGYTTGSCATAGMKAGLLALLDKNIVDQVVIENPQGQYIEVPIKAVEIISDTAAIPSRLWCRYRNETRSCYAAR